MSCTNCLQYIAGIIRDNTTANGLTLADLQSMQATGNFARPFGGIEVDYAGVRTMADGGKVELEAIRKVLEVVLA